MASHSTIPGLAQALAVIAVQRDEAAWAVVINGMGATLHGIATRLAGSVSLADDAVQEALLQVRDHAGDFTPTGANPDQEAQRWMVRIAINVAVEVFRRQQRLVNRDRRAGDAVIMPPTPEPGARMVHHETIALVRQELAELPEPTRAAIVLHVMEGLGYEEVAATLAIPVGTAKARVSRGLERMRGRLGKVGMACSLAMVVGALQQVSAAPIPTLAPDSGVLWRELLDAPRSSSVPYAGASSSWSTTLIAAISAAAMIAGLVLFVALRSSPTATIMEKSETTNPTSRLATPTVTTVHSPMPGVTPTTPAIITARTSPPAPTQVLPLMTITADQIHIVATNRPIHEVVAVVSRSTHKDVAAGSWFSSNADHLVTFDITASTLPKALDQLGQALGCIITVTAQDISFDEIPEPPLVFPAPAPATNKF